MDQEVSAAAALRRMALKAMPCSLCLSKVRPHSDHGGPTSTPGLGLLLSHLASLLQKGKAPPP